MQRLTGQATTALGNVITNMYCCMEIIEDGLETNKIRLGLFLGDDVVLIMNK